MTINKRKIAIVGCGSVGSSLAFSLLTQGVCDVLLLVDLNEEKAYGEVFDLNNCIEYLDRNTKVMYGTYADCADADIIVIAASQSALKEEEKDDSLKSSINLIKFIVQPIMASGFDGIFVNVSQPVDAITQYIYELSGLPRNQVLGIGTILDSARLKIIIARMFGVSPKSVQAFTMGEHGSSQIIPWSLVTIEGKSIYDVLSENPELTEETKFEELVQKKIMEGWETIERKGTTCYGLASATAGIIKAIINDESRTLPVSAYLDGEYEETDVFCGVPAVINRKGVVHIMELDMAKAEQIRFRESAKAVRETFRQMKNNIDSIDS